MKATRYDRDKGRYVESDDVSDYFTLSTGQGRLTIIDNGETLVVRLDEAMAIEPSSGNQIAIRRRTT